MAEGNSMPNNDRDTQRLIGRDTFERLDLPVQEELWVDERKANGVDSRWEVVGKALECGD